MYAKEIENTFYIVDSNVFVILKILIFYKYSYESFRLKGFIRFIHDSIMKILNKLVAQADFVLLLRVINYIDYSAICHVTIIYEDEKYPIS